MSTELRSENAENPLDVAKLEEFKVLDIIINPKKSVFVS
jgi:hypothetical protein